MSADRPAERELDHLEEAGRSRGRTRRRTTTAGIAAVAVLGVAGAGAWGLAQFLDGGTPAAAAVPQGALAYLSLDLDPDGGQKVEVARTLRKFPAVREKIGSSDDLRRWIFDAVMADAPCDDLDFADDIDPWLGNKVAFALVPGTDGEEAVPMAAVEIKDEQAAEAGVETILACGQEGGEAEQPGLAFVDGFMVVAGTDAVAGDLVTQVEAGSLADDEEFGRWVEEAGGSGIVTGFVSADAPSAMTEAMRGEGGGQFGPGAAMSPFGTPGGMAEAFEEFEGGALSLRFDDESLEVELAGGGMPSDVAAEGGSGMADLPATTAVALGLAFSDTAAAEIVDRLTEALGERQAEQLLATAESQTGLSLPEDLQTLMGDGLSVAVDGSVDLESVLGGGGGAAGIPVGARIVGDPGEIVPLLERLIASAGVEGEVVVESGDGVVAFGLDPAHVASLAKDGGLGDQAQFDSVLPDLEERSGGLYVDFDAEDWLATLADQDAELRENLEPLGSLGITSWQDGDVVHGRVRLSTD